MCIKIYCVLLHLALVARDKSPRRPPPPINGEPPMDEVEATVLSFCTFSGVKENTGGVTAPRPTVVQLIVVAVRSGDTGSEPDASSSPYGKYLSSLSSLRFCSRR